MRVSPIVAIVAGTLTAIGLAVVAPPVPFIPSAVVRADWRIPVAQEDVELQRFVTRFLAATHEYEDAIRNMVAEEGKTIEVFSASGSVEKRRQIVSDLVVYRSPRDGAATTEFRDVRMVDGRAIENRGARALKLLTRASAGRSIEQELEAIDRETSKYEFRRHLRGYAIRQRMVFERQPEAFHIETAGREPMQGREIVVLDYRQTLPRPGTMQFPLPRALGNPPRLQRGRLWIDARTAQLCRETWEVTVPHAASREPLVVLRLERSYAPSRFGVLLPQRIVFDWYLRFSHPKNGRPSLLLSERTTFTYGDFRRFAVTTEEKIRSEAPATRKGPQRAR